MGIEIQVGMRVALFVPQSLDGTTETTLSLPSVVEELPDEVSVLIQAPMYQGYYFPLPLAPVDMRFFVESRPFSLRVRYEERVMRENITMVRMQRLSAISRHQLRETFRLDCNFPVVIERKPAVAGSGCAADAYALDISGGGMLLFTNEDVKRKEKITVTIDIGGEETLECFIVRLDEHEDEQAKYRYKVGVKFNHQSKAQQDRIYKYVMKKQLERKREGKA